jgi:glycosyltransferase involved in cell wall biosynthesis
MRSILILDSGLSVVVPVFNEAEHIAETLTLAHQSLDKSGIPFEIIVSDDGSSDESKLKVCNLSLSHIHLLENSHKGRIATRLSGVTKARFENVLLLDARIRLDADSILSLKDLILDNPGSVFWNGHINLTNLGKVQVSIWQTLVAIGWGSYARNPRLCSFGIDEFDRYPKGTGLFLAPRNLWIMELTELQKEQENTSTNLSDDTRLLRKFAEQSSIWISPKFSANYQPRVSTKSFLANLIYRGSTFVDSYWNSPGLVGKMLKFVIPTMMLVGIGSAFILDLSAWTIALIATLVALNFLLGIVSYRIWGSATRAIREGLLGFVFWPVFGIGLGKGYIGRIRNMSSI